MTGEHLLKVGTSLFWGLKLEAPILPAGSYNWVNTLVRGCLYQAYKLFDWDCVCNAWHRIIIRCCIYVTQKTCLAQLMANWKHSNLLNFKTNTSCFISLLSGTINLIYIPPNPFVKVLFNLLSFVSQHFLLASPVCQGLMACLLMTLNGQIRPNTGLLEAKYGLSYDMFGQRINHGKQGKLYFSHLAITI